jgi:putative acetyltransferase
MPVREMIREYVDKDCEGVIEAWHAASLVATPFLSDKFMSEERGNIRTNWLPLAETWVSEVDDTVAGFISLIGNEVGAIFVHPDYQGRGIGRELMDHAVSLRDELFLDVFEENNIGRRFYDRYGFQFENKHLHDDTGHMQLRLSYGASKNNC